MEALNEYKPSISELRELIKAVTGAEAREILPFSLLASGFTKGSVVEVVGSGKTEFVAKFLAENKALRVAWIESELTIYPFAFVQRGVELSQILFVEADRESLWSTMQILQAQIFKVVVLSFSKFDDRSLRKIQLAAEKAQSLVILLSEASLGSWVPSMQILVERTPQNVFQTHFLRRRG